MTDRPRYAPGEQPYDRLNAVRIGALTGGVIGIIPAAVLGAGYAFLLLVGAAIGAYVGKRWADRAARSQSDS